MSLVEIIKMEQGFVDDQKTGWSAYPFASAPGGALPDIRAVHVVAIYPGQVRGNHYHERTDETILVFSGEGVLYYEEGGVLREAAVGGKPTLIMIPHGVRHAFRNTGRETVHLLAARAGEDDPGKPDIVRSVIVPA